MKVLLESVFDLDTTNVTEDATLYPSYSSSTVYSIGDRANNIIMVQSSLNFLGERYRSLRDNNVGNVPNLHLDPEYIETTSTTSLTAGIGSHSLTVEAGVSLTLGLPVKITKTSTPLSLSMLAEVTAYNITTGALTVNAYSLSGSGTSAEWTIKSQEEVTLWEDTGPAEPTAMWVESSSYTSNDDGIEVKLGVINCGCVLLTGLSGGSVEVEVWDSTETTLLSSHTKDITIDTPFSDSDEDQYEYYYSNMRQISSVVIDFDEVHTSAVLAISILPHSSGDAVYCGFCRPGRTITIGKTQYDPNLGFVNYSGVEENEDTGVFSVTSGYSAKRHSMSFRVDNNRIDYIYKLMAKLNGTSAAWIANPVGFSYESLIIYGIFTDFDITIPGPISSICTIEVSGVTADSVTYIPAVPATAYNSDGSTMYNSDGSDAKNSA